MIQIAFGIIIFSIAFMIFIYIPFNVIAWLIFGKENAIERIKGAIGIFAFMYAVIGTMVFGIWFLFAFIGVGWEREVPTVFYLLISSVAVGVLFYFFTKPRNLESKSNI